MISGFGIELVDDSGGLGTLFCSWGSIDFVMWPFAAAGVVDEMAFSGCGSEVVGCLGGDREDQIQ